MLFYLIYQSIVSSDLLLKRTLWFFINVFQGNDIIALRKRYREMEEA